jgi:hypothetical protein
MLCFCVSLLERGGEEKEEDIAVLEDSFGEREKRGGHATVVPHFEKQRIVPNAVL